MRKNTLRIVIAEGALLVCLLAPTLAFAQATQPTNTPAPNPTATTPTAQTNTQTPGSATGSFVPLTHLPQIQSLASSQGFGTFVNTFYKILIGVGAVLAVLMIMYAGFEFMRSTGSVRTNEKAKSRIQNALLGLLLILSPVIVFNIINPNILNLNLGTEFENLKSNAVQSSAFVPSGNSSNNSNSYVLAYYFTKTNTSTNYTCYVSSVQSFNSQADCNTAKNNVPVTIGQPSSGTTLGSITYVNSCTVADPSSVSVTPPNNIPQCPD